ncbi:MAG TPA: low specificity L-threonine aldolase [Gemmatimonadaceae bacterium]|jgi:threonine aldolase|nr:low specificity L-threonine aldolase [Gemmatimonadaceae bacterium]
MSDHSAFASDNWAPVHPAVLAALTRANSGHVQPYGADPFTGEAVERVRAAFGPSADPYFVFNGTSANVLAIGSCCRPYETVICAETAHIVVDECGAVERLLGVRLTTVPSPSGKLTIDGMMSRVEGKGDEHKVQPRCVSIAQSTECGTVYTASEVRALVEAAHAAGLLVHMDGGRLANAAAALGVSLAATTVECGVDVVSFGGTKNGAMAAEAVIFFNAELARDFVYRRKQMGQLASKMRYAAVQFTALLTDDLWRTNAAHANAMARRMAEGLSAIPRVTLTQPVEANEVFATVPPDAVADLERGGAFYVWDARRTEIRLVCAFDTTPGDVDRFVSHARQVLLD